MLVGVTIVINRFLKLFKVSLAFHVLLNYSSISLRSRHVQDPAASPFNIPLSLSPESLKGYVKVHPLFLFSVYGCMAKRAFIMENVDMEGGQGEESSPLFAFITYTDVLTQTTKNC
jgi:hypothetical protein